MRVIAYAFLFLFASAPPIEGQFGFAGGAVGGPWGGRRGGMERLKPRLPEIHEALARGLEWLRAEQDADGGWSLWETKRGGKGKARIRAGDVGAKAERAARICSTALVMQAFIGSGHTMRGGLYKDVVGRAVEWLVECQQKDGSFGTRGPNALSEHAMATFALSEIVGLSFPFREPSRGERQDPDEKVTALRRATDASVAYLANARNRDGGWNSVEKGKPSEMLATCWAVCALRSAQRLGFASDDAALVGALVFIKSTTLANAAVDAPTAAVSGGSSKRADTGAGVWCRFFLGAVNPTDADHRKYLTSVRARLKKPPDIPKRGANMDLPYSMLGALASYQVGPPNWNAWSQFLRKLANRQTRRGKDQGYWKPLGSFLGQRDRIVQTALGLQVLETYYRFTRLVR